LLETAISEIEKPSGYNEFYSKLKIRAGEALPLKRDELDALMTLCRQKSVSFQKASVYEAIANFTRGFDFVLARNLMIFGLIIAAAFFMLRFTAAENAIYLLYGSAAYYIFLILLTPGRAKKNMRKKNAAIREYRENIIAFAAETIKKYGLDKKKYPVGILSNEPFLGLEKCGDIYFLKTE